MVKEGDEIAKGAPVFHSKKDPRFLFVSPVQSGTVKEVVRGAKRKILKIVVEQQEGDVISHKNTCRLNLEPRRALPRFLLCSGAWPFIKERPYVDITADPDVPLPKAIYVSTYASAPLDVDFAICTQEPQGFDFQKGD